MCHYHNEALLQVAVVADGCLFCLYTRSCINLQIPYRQPGLCVTSFQFIQTFYQNFLLLAQHHYYAPVPNRRGH